MARTATAMVPPAEKVTVLELVCPVWNARLAGPGRLSREQERDLTESVAACAVAEPWGFTDVYARGRAPCRECIKYSVRIPNAYEDGGVDAAFSRMREFANHFVMEHRSRFEQNMLNMYRREAGL